MKKISGILFVNLILIGAFLLRALYLDHANGLTLSEISAFKDITAFHFDEILKNLVQGRVVFSLNSFISAIVTAVFGNTIFVLRFLFVVFGLLTCFCAYFTCEKPQNYFCVTLFAINSFLINYSQEIGIYSFLGLLGVLNIISFLKIKNEDNYYFLWVLSSVCLVLTSVFSIFFILLEILVILIFNRKDKKFLKASMIWLICLIPLFGYIAYAYELYINTFIGFDKNYSDVFSFVQNTFSPVLANINSSDVTSYFENFYFNLSPDAIIFILAPVLIGLYFVVKSIFKDQFNIILFFVGFLYFLIRILLQINFGIPFATGEYILFVIILLILMAKGCDKDIVSICIFGLFIFINLAYLIIQDDSAFKNNRNGVLNTTSYINSILKERDIVLTWTRLDDYKYYLSKDVKVLNLKDDFVAKTEEELVSSFIISNKMLSKNKRDSLRQYFVSRVYPKNTIDEARYIFGYLGNDNRLYMIYPNLYSDNYDAFLSKVATDEIYYSIPYDELMEELAIVQANKILLSILNFERKEVIGDFIINIYKK